MSERNFNVSGTVKVREAKIVSVEKGNVDKTIPVASKVCAFSMQVKGSSLPVKIILKGQMAVDVYQELKDGKTMSCKNSETIVNLDAEVREIREKEFVVHNPSNIEFYKAKVFKAS